VLLPFSASQGPAYESYMEVSTLVGIYIAMALGLNIVVGLAGLLDLGFVAFFAVGAYTYGIFATNQAANFMPFGTYPLSGESFWFFIIAGMPNSRFIWSSAWYTCAARKRRLSCYRYAWIRGNYSNCI